MVPAFNRVRAGIGLEDWQAGPHAVGERLMGPS